MRLSNARVAEKAQAVFAFNDSIDARRLKLALQAALERAAAAAGHEATVQDLRRAIDLAAMREPEALRSAVKSAQAARTRLAEEQLPGAIFDGPDAVRAQLSAYGIFPSNMNGPERGFAELIDADQSGTVQWWLRNPENVTWATRMILPTGRRFFPDFAIGVQGRSSRNSIALVEIKDDGIDGRLNADVNILKIQIRHREYGRVTWAAKGPKGYERMTFNEGVNRIVPRDMFEIAHLVLTD